MLENGTDTTVVRQVELAISRLDSLPTLPCVAIQYFSKLSQSRFSSPDLAEIVESDPALAVKIFSLAHQQGIHLSDLKFSLRLALDKLPAHLVRQAILSVRVSAGPEPEAEADRAALVPKKELILHSLAVACCAKDVAETLPSRMEPQLAYYAGLLHDIGKSALDQVMPKSFTQIVEQASAMRTSSYVVEQTQLDTNHALLGKRLAQKWHLPEAVTLAIWLHHSDTATIVQHVPDARIAQVVQLADSLARQSGIGQSGSYDSPEPVEEMAQSLGVTLEQIEQIRNRLPEAVGEKSKALGLNLPNAAARYCQFAHATAARFAQQQDALSTENRQLRTASTHLDFVTDFLLGINSGATAIDVAESFATRWQKFYQTGTVCLYLVPASDSQAMDAVLVESLAQSRQVCLTVPADSEPVPEAIAKEFAVLDAEGHVDWLFEQLEIDFDARRTKLLPLLSDSRAVGIMVFELHWPADAVLFEERFKISAAIAGVVLDMMLNRHKYECFAERFAQLIRGPAGPVEARGERAAGPSEAEATPAEIAAGASLEALAEMAAGMAHELNDPLSVILGRAELVAEGETDQKKKQALQQIQENAREVSAILEDLMSFAEPPPPKPSQTDVKQMLDEALQLASLKTGAEHINTQIQTAKDAKSVFVDSAQVVSAMANVISNSLESYAGEMGPIKISGDAIDNRVRLQISDLGCGMDTETLRKATHPFFSAKPAGRKRGMGLAYAARLLQQNKATLSMESELGKGTTVTIHLPIKQSS